MSCETCNESDNELLNNISNFCKTYDFEIFDTFPEYVKNLFYEYAKRRKQNSITQIVQNHELISTLPNIPRFMLGPVSIDILKDNETGKVFYLFGDVHIEKRKGCMNPNDRAYEYFSGNKYLYQPPMFFSEVIPDYLGSLDKIVDVYVEGKFHIHKKTHPKAIKKELHDYDNNLIYYDYVRYMYRFEQNFMLCTHPFTEDPRYECKYKNIRVHRADIRKVDVIEEPNIEDISYIGWFLKFIFDEWYQKIFYENLNINNCESTMIKFKRDFDQMKNTNKDKQNIRFRKYILKQIEKIKDKTFAQKIQEDLDGTIEKLGLLSLEFENYLSKVSSERIHFYALENVAKKVIDVGAQLMDLYFIARCYREFEGTRHGFPNVPCQNIVAYFGDAHVIDIVDLLKKYRNIEVIYEFRNINVDECPDYGVLKSPWFGKDLV
jgi:hypothetical protein